MRLLLFTLALGLLALPAHAARIEVQKGVAYGKGYVKAENGSGYELRELLLDVYAPKDRGDAPRPAVVLLHGGSFMRGKRGHDDLVSLARHLARNGYVCFSGDYRLMKDDPPAASPWSVPQLRRAMHACFVDAKAMVAHVRAQAEAYHVDPSRVGFLGDSAGGFAAYALAASDENAFTRDREDLPIPPGNPTGVATKPDAVVILWANGDFVLDEFDAQDPPLMIVHGTDDGEFGTPFRAAETAVKAARAAGVDVTFHPIEGADHGAWDAKVDGQDINELVETFLKEHL